MAGPHVSVLYLLASFAVEQTRQTQIGDGSFKNACTRIDVCRPTAYRWLSPSKPLTVEQVTELVGGPALARAISSHSHVGQERWPTVDMVRAWFTWFALYELCDGTVARLAEYMRVRKAYRQLARVESIIGFKRPPDMATYARIAWGSPTPGRLVVSTIYDHYQELVRSGQCVGTLVKDTQVRFHAPESSE